MSAASAIDPTSTTLPTKTDAFSALDSEQFVKIIFTELSNQDPLQPSDSKALLDQLSSLRSIQSNIDLQSKLNNLVAQNELSAASGLIGKQVSGLDDQSTRVQGVVRSVSRTADGAVLNLVGGQRVPMSSMDQVLGASGGGQ